MKRREFMTGLGAAAVWPIATKAQQRGATPIVGFLSARSAADSADVETAFRKGMNETGYSDKTNVRIVHRWADGRFVRRTLRVAAVHWAEQVSDVELIYHVRTGKHTERVVQAFRMRWFTPAELLHLLARAGFRLEAMYGGFDRQPLVDESPEIVVVACGDESVNR